MVPGVGAKSQPTLVARRVSANFVAIRRFGPNRLAFCSAKEHFARMNSFAYFALIVVIALQSTDVLGDLKELGDDYKEATEAAYCIGVYQSDVEFWREKDPKSPRAVDLEMKQFRKQAFVEGAIKQQIIDGVTVSKMRAVGYADANSCLQQRGRCTQQFYEHRQQGMDDEQNNKIFENCNELADVCERAYKNCG